LCGSTGRGSFVHEADISAESAPPGEDARVSGAHEDQGRPQSAETPASQGAQTARRLDHGFPRRERLTTSADFQALFHRGKRIDRRSLIVLWRDAEEPRRAGFAVSRQVRGAVARNRARRRLREAYRMTRESAPATTALIVIGRPAALKVAFPVLKADLREALEAIPRPRLSP
jgi:ribonuclease P protein component